MAALSNLRAVDRVTAHLCAELRARAVPHSRHGTLIFLKDIPAQFRPALARQGVRELLEVGDQKALRLEHVEAWLRDVKRAFHTADSAESISGLTYVRRLGLAGIADGKLGRREALFAQQHARKQGVGPLMTMIAQQLGLPLLPAPQGASVLPPPPDQVLPPRLVNKLLADDNIETHEVWQLVHRARERDPDTRGQEALTRFRDRHSAAFTAEARAALDEYLASGAAIIDGTTPSPHEGLLRLWRDTRAEWDLSVITPPAREHTPEEMLRLAKGIFTSTNDEGYRLATEVKAFFEKYPSTGGRSLSSFFSGWAINETFGSLPLQAFNYTMAHPIDATGNPRGPLWRAYVALVRSGAPREIIEEAFLRAHIADYKRATLHPTFRKLYTIAPASYRKVIDAYVDTLRNCEAELDVGTKPTTVAKWYPLSVTRELVKRGSMGMVWNSASFRNGLNPWNPLTREWWFGFWGMLGTALTGRHPKTAKADAIAVDVRRDERLELKCALGLDLPAGVSTIEKKQLEHATFSEPLRGAASDRRLPRYPLLLSDFDRVDPIHAPMPVSGADGVFQAKELLGVVRQAQARVRSNLIHDFHAKYPTPMNGLLVYSANMLALTGAYHQHKAYGMVPNFIMPVDNFGRAKTDKWQAYVDAHVSARESGAPSKEAIERLWFEAHMEDFEQIDTPEFRAQAELFWREAIRDPALAPLATYFIAMVHGRQVYEEARAEKLPYEEALVRAFDHFRRTLLTSGSIPFLGEEVRSVAKLLGGGRGPAFDSRGLPTDRTLTMRMLEGLWAASGIARTLVRGGVFNARGPDGKHVAVHTVTDRLLDLREVMSPQDFAKVHSSVRSFYLNPTRFRGESQIEMMGDETPPVSMCDFIAKVINASLVRVVSKVGAAVIGTQQSASGEFAFEDDLVRDRKGETHWNRYVVGANGHRKALFLASFAAVDGQVRETFQSSLGFSVPLYFDVEPYDGGVRLKLDKSRSSKLLSTFADVTFVSRPGEDGKVIVRGELKHKHLVRAVSTFDAIMVPERRAGDRKEGERDDPNRVVLRLSRPKVIRLPRKSGKATG